MLRMRQFLQEAGKDTSQVGIRGFHPSPIIARGFKGALGRPPPHCAFVLPSTLFGAFIGMKVM